MACSGVAVPAPPALFAGLIDHRLRRIGGIFHVLNGTGFFTALIGVRLRVVRPISGLVVYGAIAIMSLFRLRRWALGVRDCRLFGCIRLCARSFLGRLSCCIFRLLIIGAIFAITAIAAAASASAAPAFAGLLVFGIIGATFAAGALFLRRTVVAVAGIFLTR